MNMVAVLKGKTQKGKQRVKQWGGSGKVMRCVESIPASPKKGKWFAVVAGDPTWRWVGLDDKDFDISIFPWSEEAVTAKVHDD